MTDSLTLPSTRLRAFAALARWALRILAMVWLTLGLFWGALHFLIVPRIGELRPWVEKQATHALGISVRIGAINAYSTGLIPAVELVDVQFLDSQGREALRLPKVLAALSPRSAWGMQFEQLYVEGATLDVRRTADGSYWVAGFSLGDVKTTDGSVADWIFSQPELALRHGKVRWTDEVRSAPTLEMDDVDLVLRNRLRSHAMRLDANPPPGWGSRFTLMGQFRQPLLTRHNGDWTQWTGQLYAQAAKFDLSHVRTYMDLGADIAHGDGALKAWVSVDRSMIQSATADVVLQDVSVRLAEGLEPVELKQVLGRLSGYRVEGGIEFATEDLTFNTHDGLHWPGGNVRLRLLDGQRRPAKATVPGSVSAAQGEFTADRVDLASVTEIAERMPLDPWLRKVLQNLSPRGRVERLQSSWEGPALRPDKFSVSGRIQGLGLAMLPDSGATGTQGVQGLNVDFNLTQKGGRAQLQMQNGALEFPGFFEQARIPMDALSSEVVWKLDGNQWTVDVNRLRFANADAQGEAQLRWKSGDGPNLSWGQRLPGQLELQGSLSRVTLTAVPRYLPLAMDKDVRAYVQQALLGGTASGVKFKVKGDLARFPYAKASEGDFRISADLQNVGYAYAPPGVMPKDSPPWPNLAQASGNFVLDRNVLQVVGARGSIAGRTGLTFFNTDAQITDLYNTAALTVSTDLRGPLAEALGVVNSSPVGVWTEHALAQTTITGNADYRLKLALPLSALEKSTVQGSVTLANSDFQFDPNTPRLQRVRGVVAFNDTGFSLGNMQARALGGDVRIEGGLNFSAPGVVSTRNMPSAIRVQGVATSDALRQAIELGPVSRLSAFATGATAYNLTLGLRGGMADLLLTSSLSGMALNLPAPLSKPAETALPLRFEMGALRNSRTATRMQDQLHLELGRLATVHYERDVSGAQTKVLRGSIAVGLADDEFAPLPAAGVGANVRVDSIDIDAWLEAMDKLNGPVATSASDRASAADNLAYLPNTMAIRARELRVEGRKINGLLVGGSREGNEWRANLEAAELNGYVEYRQGSGVTPGRLYARLPRLVLGQSSVQEVENLLDQQPASIPALDVVVDELELRGKKLGRVEVQAVNRSAIVARDTGREWLLNRFDITTPEAMLTATGNWAAVVTPGSPGATMRERRRTALNFKLDISDSGALLKRFGMSDVIAKGQGTLEGRVAWMGSPITPDFSGMEGGFHVNVERGQFLKADPGIAKLLGVLSLQSLPRRLVLDFRDVFSEGFAFDFVRGDVNIEQGIARTNNLQMKGVNAAVLMEGQADIAKETQHIKVVVVPEINAGSASLIASTINPLIGLSTFLAQLILRIPLIDATTQEFLIDGTWLEPRVTQVDRK